jgi:hypothetical protein
MEKMLAEAEGLGLLHLHERLKGSQWEFGFDNLRHGVESSRQRNGL